MKTAYLLLTLLLFCTGGLTAQTASQSVTGFILVDAATEQDISPVTDGSVIVLSSLEHTKLNLRVSTSPATVGSVKFELSGTQSKSYTDSSAPYALHGDNGKGNYFYGNWNPPATGTYTLKATPYSGSKATGTAGTPTTITFTFTEQEEEPVEDLTPPSVISINRQSPTTQTTNATTVVYRATFSEKVTGVDAADFTTTTVSGTVKGNVISATAVGTTGTTYDVTVGSISGEGTLRLDLKSSGTGIADAAGNTIQGGFFSGQAYTFQTTTSTEGFASVTKLSPVSIHTNLGDQPQSKVWTYDGKWWAVMPETGTGTHIWRLNGTTWAKASAISTSAYTKADCKVVGNVVHIFLYRGSSLPSELISVEYAPSSGTYKPWAERGYKTSVQLDPGVKTATIDVDGNGRMWLVSNGDNNVYARWSDRPYTSWSSPVTIATGLSNDDISAVIYMPASKKTGILWSNQNTKRFGFKTHADGESPASWSSDEVPASQSAIESGDGMADDHLNMAVASDGTLYCAVKTGYRDSNPRIALLVRRPTGTWDNLYKVSEAGNRPIVILNEAIGKLKVIYAAPNAGGIFYKESPVSGISFGSEQPLINETCDYATSSKANYSSDIVIFASTSQRAYSVLATDNLSSTAIAAAYASPPLEQVHITELTAFPNPFDSRTTINITSPHESEYSLVLYDMKGTKVKALKEGKAMAGETTSIDLDGSKLPNGLYLAKLMVAGKISTIKILLER